MTKKLYKSEQRTLCGVCGGVAEYFNIDPTLVRLAWIVLTLAGGSGILAYIICALVIPAKPSSQSDWGGMQKTAGESEADREFNSHFGSGD